MWNERVRISLWFNKQPPLKVSYPPSAVNAVNPEVYLSCFTFIWKQVQLSIFSRPPLMWVTFLTAFILLLQLIISSYEAKTARFDSGSCINVFCTDSVCFYTVQTLKKQTSLFCKSPWSAAKSDADSKQNKLSLCAKALQRPDIPPDTSPVVALGALLCYAAALLPNKMAANTDKCETASE